MDAFLGNLHHLDAEEEPERPYRPKDDPAVVKAASPHGALKTSADGRIEDTGPLAAKRMERIDQIAQDVEARIKAKAAKAGRCMQGG